MRPSDMRGDRGALASTEKPGSNRGLSAEGRLLLAMAGGDAMDATVRELASVPLDWGALIALAVQERAEAVVSARLARVAAPVPDAARDTLRALAMRSDLRMAVLSRRLDQTVAAMAEAKVPVLLLKGAALGRVVYGGTTNRPMLDIDLLVPGAQAREAREVALATDWVPGDMERKVEFYEGHNHLAPLHDGRGRDFNLEIHTGLFTPGHPFAWPLSAVWESSQPLAGSAARVQPLEDLLLHVTLHFFWSHAGYFGPWRAMRDVRATAEDPRLDWHAFTRRARETRAASAAHWTLRLARLLAGAAIPAEVERDLRPAVPSSVLPMLDRHFYGRWFAPEAACPSQRLERWLWRAAVRPVASGHGGSVPWTRDPLFLDRATDQAAGTGGTEGDTSSGEPGTVSPLPPQHHARCQSMTAVAAMNVGEYQGAGPEWDDFVRAQTGWTHFHLHGWRGVMERVLKHQCPYLAAREADGTLAGVLPLVRVKSLLFGHFLVSQPFVNYGGPLGSRDAVRALTGAAVERATRTGAGLLELRSRVELPLDLPVSHRKITVLLDLEASDPERTFKRFEAKLRSQIRRPHEGRASRSGSGGTRCGPSSRYSPITCGTSAHPTSRVASSRRSPRPSRKPGSAAPGWAKPRSPAASASAGATNSR